MKGLGRIFSRKDQHSSGQDSVQETEGDLEFKPFFSEEALIKILRRQGNIITRDALVYDDLCSHVRHYGWDCGEIVVDEHMKLDEFEQSLSDIGYGINQSYIESETPFVVFIRWNSPTRNIEDGIIDRFRHEVQIDGLRAIMFTGEEEADIHQDIWRNATGKFF